MAQTVSRSSGHPDTHSQTGIEGVAEIPVLPSEEQAKRVFSVKQVTSKHLYYFTLTIMFAPVAVSSLTRAGGAAALYWIVGFVGFLLPSALITIKLGKMFPGTGAFYTWV